MTQHEAGFIDGERDAFQERRAGMPMRSFEPPANAYQRGYVAGYMPRNASWWVRPSRIVPRVVAA